jgi:hypothetical protein
VKDVLLAVLALCAGLVLGGAASQLRVAELERELAEASRQACDHPVAEAAVPAPPEVRLEGTSDPHSTGETAIEARRAMAHRALMETARPDERQLAAMEEAWAAMNRDLQALAQRRPDPGVSAQAHALRTTAAALEILARGHERAFSVLTEDQQKGVPKVAVDPLSYVQPGLLERIAAMKSSP